MRNFTLKPLLFCTALAGMALQGTIKAQDITFRAAENEEAEAIGVNTSDGVPVVADFDNNGFIPNRSLGFLCVVRQREIL